LLQRLLVCADFTAASLASLSLALVGDGRSGGLVWAIAVLPAWILIAQLLGLYDRDDRVLRHQTVDEIPQLVLWALIGTSCLVLALALGPTERPSPSAAFVVAMTAALCVFLLRSLARGVWQLARGRELVAILGSASSADAIDRMLERHPNLNMTIVDQWLDLDVEHPDSLRWLRSIDRLLFAPDTLDDERVGEVIMACREAGVTLNLFPPSSATFDMAVELDRLAGLPVLVYRTGGPSWATLAAKRGLDIALSAVGLILLLPVLGAVAMAIKLDSRGPILFRQERVGLMERRFWIFKFRTMVADAEERLVDVVHLNRHAATDPRMFKAVDDPRVTRVGRFLRRMSLDEIPQLLNVVRGEMSLVGPRPLILEEDQHVIGLARLRLTVRPGITGLWQVSGASELPFSEMIRLDCEYVADLSMGRDVGLILRTIPVLVGRRAR
jgi:exopolysaccharide biosynthesis polyprenyl glycosylphosphotransferase